MVKIVETLDKPALLATRPHGKGDLTESAIVWRATRSIPEAPSMIYYRDRLYAVRDGGILVCYNPASGEVRYNERLGATGLYTASPVAANGCIYFCAAKGDVIVVKAGDEFKVVARNKINEAIYATPALVGNRLYLRTLEHLYAFEAESDAR